MGVFHTLTLKSLIGCYIAYLLLSATFARQALAGLTHFFGKHTIQEVPWMLLVFVILLIVWGLVRQRKHSMGVFLSILSTVGIFLFLRAMQNPDERIHIFQYGLLGFLVMLEVRNRPLKMSLYLALGVVVLTACADELFQAFLPYRVGDIRDVGFGLVGGAWGTLQAWVFSHNPEKRLRGRGIAILF